MKRKSIQLALIIFLLFPFLTSCLSPATYYYKPNYIVLLSNKNNFDTIASFCTGIVLNRKQIISVHHCYKNKFVLINNYFYPIKLKKLDQNRDLSLFEINDSIEIYSYPKLSEKDNSFLSSTTFFGNCPLQNYYIPRNLFFLGETLDHYDTYRTDSFLCSGDSGGAVLEKENEFRGLLSKVLKEDEENGIFWGEIGFFVSATTIKEFLGELEKQN